MIERLFDAAPNTPEGEALEILAILVEDYKKRIITFQYLTP
jgi:hypothetical protein